MLAIQNKQLNSIFERIVKDKNGTLVRVRFTVVDGRGQIVSIEPISKKEKLLCLPIFNISKSTTYTFTPSFASKISPYFSLEFFMSQPTRAPAL